jgi:hypothetical protein
VMVRPSSHGDLTQAGRLMGLMLELAMDGKVGGIGAEAPGLAGATDGNVLKCLGGE